MRKSIGLKIMVPFCILAIVCGLCSTLIYSKIAQMNQATKSISDNYMTRRQERWSQILYCFSISWLAM